MSDFSGQTALVTGASRGIGRAVAIELAQRGANVGINFRSHPEEAEEVAELVRATGQQAVLCQADVASQSDVEAMVQKVVNECGAVNLFVSNAAYSDRELMVEADMEGFRRTVDVTMWGAFYGLRASAQQMVRQKSGGAICIVSSPHGVIPIPTAMAYNMSKAAIDHMGRTAAIELAREKIRVNMVHPGWIDTPGERKFFTEEQIEAGVKPLPMQRMGQPDEIARAVAYVLSPAAAFMTGSTLTIDGGVSLPWWSNRADGQM